jgi:hypothetical protein
VDYQPVQEWRSSDGGRTFKIVDRGFSIGGRGTYDKNQVSLNAVVMPTSSCSATAG